MIDNYSIKWGFFLYLQRFRLKNWLYKSNLKLDIWKRKKKNNTQNVKVYQFI